MRRRRRRKTTQEVSAGAPAWLTTYSDLVTLLLCFFVLIYSMAILDAQKFEKVAFSLRSSFSHISSGDKYNYKEGDTMISITPYDDGKELLRELGELSEEDETGKSGDEDDDKDPDAQTLARKQESIRDAKVNVQNMIDEMGLNENVKVLDEEKSLILRVDSLILFDSGSAELKESGKPVLEKMGVLLKNLKTDILVQGHADDRPIHTTIFPSNWELSTKRATNVVKFFIERSSMEQKYLTATGNAEFKPIVPNDTAYNRQKNRRIDIVIMK